MKAKGLKIFLTPLLLVTIAIYGLFCCCSAKTYSELSNNSKHSCCSKSSQKQSQDGHDCLCKKSFQGEISKKNTFKASASHGEVLVSSKIFDAARPAQLSIKSSTLPVFSGPPIYILHCVFRL